MVWSIRMWQVACGTQNWIQLVRWFRLISALPLARVVICIMGKWRAVILCCAAPLTGSCSATGSTVMCFWLELSRVGGRTLDSIFTASHKQAAWLVSIDAVVRLVCVCVCVHLTMRESLTVLWHFGTDFCVCVYVKCLHVYEFMHGWVMDPGCSYLIQSPATDLSAYFLSVICWGDTSWEGRGGETQ